MRQEDWINLPDKAKAKDHPMPRALWEWAENNDYTIANEEKYYQIYMEDGYTVCFSRASFKLQCYYMGYGYDTIEKHIEDFEDLVEVIDHIMYWKRNYTTTRSDAVEWVSQYMIGRQNTNESYEKMWQIKMKEYFEMTKQSTTRDLISEIFS
jgi:hypothetical protein